MIRLRPALIAAIAAVTAPLPGLAQQQHLNMPGMKAPAASSPGSNMPAPNMEDVFSKIPLRLGLGELMMAFVQPRHIKLGLAGAAQNWDYAAYELDELKETFDGIGQLILKHGTLAIPDAIASTVKPPMDAIDAAIKAKDEAAFTKAYGELTTACNACHQSADHKMIVIQVPTVSGTAFPDQDFNPQK
jgi:hypothetical protein